MKIDKAILNNPVQHKRSSVYPPEKTVNLFKREWTFPGFRNQSKFKQRFFSELGILLGSGLDIKSSLDIIINSSSRENDLLVLKKIQTRVIDGASLSLALNSLPLFNQYDVQTISIGEESGALSTVLSDLTEYYNRRIFQQRQLMGALSYPGLVLFTTMLSLGFMLGYIVPMFEDIFNRFNTDLPALTKTIIKLSGFVKIYLKYIIVVLIAGSLVAYYYRRNLWVRKYSSTLLLKTPVIGKIILLSYKVRFCQTLKLLAGTKVHLAEAINLIEKMIGFYPFEKALGSIKNEIVLGVSLSEAMGNTNVFDNKMIALTKVAEEVNKIEVVYGQLLKQYSDELDARVKIMNSLLEPILIIVVGCMVAIMLISMYLPIFKIGTGIF